MVPAEAMERPLHIVERMINQNLHNDLAMDFKVHSKEEHPLNPLLCAFLVPSVSLRAQTTLRKPRL